MQLHYTTDEILNLAHCHDDALLQVRKSRMSAEDSETVAVTATDAPIDAGMYQCGDCTAQRRIS